MGGSDACTTGVQERVSRSRDECGCCDGHSCGGGSGSRAGSSGAFERTWGKDVVAGGGTGFEVCTIAASCQQGASGWLGGEFRDPFGAAAAAGRIYVADFINQRIQRFDALGNFQRAWGKDVVAGGGTGFEVCTAKASCKAAPSGALGGELHDPYDVAADAAGNVYVADTGNHRIQKFNASGTWERAWGKDVVTGGGTDFEICTVAASCKAASTSAVGPGGELDGPEGVATDAAGNVYVGDAGGNRIQKFNASGTWERAWGKDVVTGGGTDFEICTVPASCKVGATGGLGGELDFPHGLATDAAGNVYAADFDNDRIQVFDASGAWQRAWGKDVIAGGGTGFEVCTVAATCKAASTLMIGPGGDLNHPTGTAVEGTSVYVAGFNGRIEKFDAFGKWQRAWGKDVVAGGGTGFEVCTVAAACKVGVDGALAGEFHFPLGIATDAAGKVYVGDRDNDRIQKFSDPIATRPPPSGGAAPPSNQFEIGRLKGRRLTVTVSGPGLVEVIDAADTKTRRATPAKRLLKPSSVTATGAGEVAVKLKLAKAAKRKLKRRGKAKVEAAVTFTPAGGSPKTANRKLKLKK